MLSLPSKETCTKQRGNLVSGKIVYQAGTSVDLHIQPVDTEYQITDNAFARSMKAWALRGTDIKQDDKITRPNGKIYKVSAVSDFNFGTLAHLEIVLEELQSESE